MSKGRLTTDLIDAGVAAENRGDGAEAERLFREAVRTNSGSAPAHMNLGIALHAKGDVSGAAAAHLEAVRLDPSSAHARYNLALALIGADDLAGAEQSFHLAIRLKPDFPEALVGLAEVLESKGLDEDALKALETAVSQRPHYAGALFNLAVLLRKMGRLDEAEASLRGVPEEHPDAANVMTALAATLRDQGRVEEAVSALRSAVDRAPRSGVAQSELLFTQGYSDSISAESLFAEHLWAGCRAEAESGPWCAEFTNSQLRDRVINVGYLSGDFGGTAVSLFTEFLFERHRRDRVKVYAYSSTPHPDANTARFVAKADAWRDMRFETDKTVATAIVADQIDVLVDLTGHTSHRRIGVLAGRAAPVQMTWLGYINTTGLTRVDYRITDPVADPPGMTERFHTEQLLRMPHSQWCFRPPPEARDVVVMREEALREFTFGSFNQSAKVTAATVALWGKALRAANGTRLRVIGIPKGRATERLSGMLLEQQIDPSRFDIVERASLGRYYEEYRCVDACLDTTPYSGGTTTCDAFWMGVPVITLTGDRSMSRSAGSLLTSLGRPDLVARTPEEFASIATRLASGQKWSTSDRLDLRGRMAASPLMDETGFTDALEGLYRTAWGAWCDRRKGY